MPTSPFQLRSTFASAVARNIVLASSAMRPERPRLETTAAFRVPKGPARLLRRFLHRDENWQLGILETDPFSSDASRVRSILQLPGALRADPFLVRHGNTDWILFEEQLRGDRGRLRAAKRVSEEWIVQDGQILDLPHHLSWPCVVEIGGIPHLLPETGEASEVALWEPVEFPGKWRKNRVLLEGRHWHDPSLFRFGNRWWLFVSAGGRHDQDHSSELHAFRMDDPLSGTPIPHPLNPLSVSVAGARPAGTPFAKDGAIFRPCQDCRGGYGTGLLLRRIEILDERDWTESVMHRIAPPPGRRGLHTLNHLDGVGWVVDVA